MEKITTKLEVGRLLDHVGSSRMRLCSYGPFLLTAMCSEPVFLPMFCSLLFYSQRLWQLWSTHYARSWAVLGKKSSGVGRQRRSKTA